MKNRWRCKCKCIKRDKILIQFPKIMRQCRLVSFFLQRQKNKQWRKLNTFVLYSMLIIIMLRAVKIVYDSHFLCAQMLPVLHLFSAISLYRKQKRQTFLLLHHCPAVFSFTRIIHWFYTISRSLSYSYYLLFNCNRLYKQVLQQTQWIFNTKNYSLPRTLVFIEIELQTGNLRDIFCQSLGIFPGGNVFNWIQLTAPKVKWVMKATIIVYFTRLPRYTLPNSCASRTVQNQWKFGIQALFFPFKWILSMVVYL